MKVRALALALALLGSACRVGPSKETTVTVERGELVIDVDVAGTLESVTSLRVGPPPLAGVWNYKIAMMAEEGTEVAKDAPVVAFDITDLQRRLERKTAERDSAAAQLLMKRSAVDVARADERLALAQARAELGKAKLKADVPAELTSSIELGKAEFELEFARKKVAYLKSKAEWATRADASQVSWWRSKRDRAEARVAEITASIQRMTVKATRGGTVVHKTNWRGEKKKVGDSAWRAETLLNVVSLAQMEGTGEVDEVDVSRVAVGQSVSLRLDAQSDVELRGRVKTISRTVKRASPDNPLKVAVLQVALDENEAIRLRPGMRFRGHIETEREADVLLVPLDALRHTPSGPVAHRRVGDATEVVAVTLGRRNDKFAIVTDGLADGDELVRFLEGPS